MLTVPVIDTILAFMGRAELKGVEVAAFVAASNALNAERDRLMSAQPAPQDQPPE